MEAVGLLNVGFDLHHFITLGNVLPNEEECDYMASVHSLFLSLQDGNRVNVSFVFSEK